MKQMLKTTLDDYMARQYAAPSGWFGRLVVGRLLNRYNRPSNAFVLQHLEFDVRKGQKLMELGFGGGDLFCHCCRMIY